MSEITRMWVLERVLPSGGYRKKVLREQELFWTRIQEYLKFLQGLPYWAIAAWDLLMPRNVLDLQATPLMTRTKTPSSTPCPEAHKTGTWWEVGLPEWKGWGLGGTASSNFSGWLLSTACTVEPFWELEKLSLLGHHPLRFWVTWWSKKKPQH